MPARMDAGDFIQHGRAHTRMYVSQVASVNNILWHLLEDIKSDKCNFRACRDLGTKSSPCLQAVFTDPCVWRDASYCEVCLSHSIASHAETSSIQHAHIL